MKRIKERERVGERDSGRFEAREVKLREVEPESKNLSSKSCFVFY